MFTSKLPWTVNEGLMRHCKFTRFLHTSLERKGQKKNAANGLVSSPGRVERGQQGAQGSAVPRGKADRRQCHSSESPLWQ